jgi:sarcosine oxidase delta subunit
MNSIIHHTGKKNWEENTIKGDEESFKEEENDYDDDDNPYKFLVVANCNQLSPMIWSHIAICHIHMQCTRHHHKYSKENMGHFDICDKELITSVLKYKNSLKKLRKLSKWVVVLNLLIINIFFFL